ncbi:Iron-only hydrogenase maturation rSAM protein HydG, partial [human gut metagenome]
FCTACYRAGRTGDRFMALAKSGQIHNCCQPNALMTLNEYIMDYGDEKTKAHGAKVIEQQLENIKNDLVKDKAKAYIAQMKDGERDFRF